MNDWFVFRYRKRLLQFFFEYHKYDDNLFFLNHVFKKDSVTPRDIRPPLDAQTLQIQGFDLGKKKS